MSNESTEQYRSGFEAWAKSRHLGLERARIVLADYARSGTEDAWQTWIAAKREASTEPSAQPVAEVNDHYSRAGYNDEINVLLPVGTKLYTKPVAGALTDDAKEQTK